MTEIYYDPHYIRILCDSLDYPFHLMKKECIGLIWIECTQNFPFPYKETPDEERSNHKIWRNQDGYFSWKIHPADKPKKTRSWAVRNYFCLPSLKKDFFQYQVLFDMYVLSVSIDRYASPTLPKRLEEKLLKCHSE